MWCNHARAQKLFEPVVCGVRRKRHQQRSYSKSAPLMKLWHWSHLRGSPWTRDLQPDRSCSGEQAAMNSFRWRRKQKSWAKKKECEIVEIAEKRREKKNKKVASVCCFPFFADQLRGFLSLIKKHVHHESVPSAWSSSPTWNGLGGAKRGGQKYLLFDFLLFWGDGWKMTQNFQK